MKHERTIAGFRKCLCGLRQPLRQPSLVRRLLDYLIGHGPAGRAILIDHYNRKIGVIDAMTFGERENPESLDAARIKRIARGAGVRPAWVRYTLEFFAYWRAGYPPFSNT
jgi:signal recognition particle GTPase